MSSGQVFSPIGYKLQIKRVIVDSLREHFTDHPSNTLAHAFITVEYPQGPERYPAIIVGYRENSLAMSGVGHLESFENISYGRWTFTGEVTLEIMALTSLERDYVSDHFVNLLAFGRIAQVPFEENVHLNQTIDLQMNLGYLTPSGEDTLSGASWGLTDARIYTCGYSFPVIGSFISSSTYEEYISSIRGEAETEDGQDSNSFVSPR